jgi:hypothetical protein
MYMRYCSLFLTPDNSIGYNFNRNGRWDSSTPVCVSVYDSAIGSTTYISLSYFSDRLDVMRLGYNYGSQSAWPNKGVARCATGSGDVWSGVIHYYLGKETSDREVSLFSNDGLECQARVVISCGVDEYVLCALELIGGGVGVYSRFEVMLGSRKITEWRLSNGKIVFETCDARIIVPGTQELNARRRIPNEVSAFCLLKKPKEVVDRKEDVLVRLRILELETGTGHFFPTSVKNGSFSLVCGMQRKIGISFKGKTKSRIFSAEIGKIVLTRNGIDHVCQMSTRYPLDVKDNDESNWLVMAWDSSLSECTFLNTVSREGDLINISLDIKLDDGMVIIPFEIQIPVRLSLHRARAWR